MSRRWASRTLTRGMTTRQPAAAAASIARLIRSTSVPSKSLGVINRGGDSALAAEGAAAMATDQLAQQAAINARQMIAINNAKPGRGTGDL